MQNILALKFNIFNINKNKEKTKHEKNQPSQQKKKKPEKEQKKKEKEVPVGILKDGTDIHFISLVFECIRQTFTFLGCSLFQSHYLQQFY